MSRSRFAALLAVLLVFSFALASCTSRSHDASAAKSAGAVVTANPQVQQARALVEHCFAGTPVQQARQIHLVFLSSKTGKNGPAVIAARQKLMSCLGISKADEKPFFNDAVTAAEHGHLTTHAGRVTYAGTTLPQLVIKYSSAPGAGNGTANIPGVTPSVSAS